MIHAAEQILKHVLSVEWEALPTEAQAAAKTFMHDSLCVGIAGSAAPDADRVWGAVQGWFGAQPGLP